MMSPTPIVAAARLVALAAFTVALAACRTTAPMLPQVAVDLGPEEVVPLSQVPDVHRRLRLVFERYSHVQAPSGRPIHIFVERGVSNPQVLRVKGVLTWLLEDAPGTRFGADKTAVAEALADAGAAVYLFEDEASSLWAQRNTLRGLSMKGRDLYADECFVIGSTEWMDNEVRDATVQELFLLVQAHGIATALPEYQAMIGAAARAAIDSGLYTLPPDLLAEWERQGRVEQEYITRVLDVALGHWAHAEGAAFHGQYQVTQPEELGTFDPAGLEALRAFLPPRYVHEVRVAPGFGGDFRLEYDPALHYTARSRLFDHVTLTGDRSANIIGSTRDEILAGNRYDNVLDGGGGVDVAVFQGRRSQYAAIHASDGGLTLADLVPGRDGADTLVNVEFVRFADGQVAVEEVQPPVPLKLDGDQ